MRVTRTNIKEVGKILDFKKDPFKYLRVNKDWILVRVTRTSAEHFVYIQLSLRLSTKNKI